MNRTTYRADEKIWSGPKQPCIYNSNVSLGYLILNALKKTPEFITQVSADTNVEITCFEMRSRTFEIAMHLQAAGYKQGDVVGIVATNSENVAPLVFACFTLGLTVNPLDPSMTENEITHMYSMTKPKVIFCDALIADKIRNSMADVIELEIYTLSIKKEGYNFIDMLSADDNEDEFLFPDPDDVGKSIAIILSSSGTSGASKGICKSHKQLIEHNYPYWEVIPNEQEVLLNFSTVFWGTAVTFLIIGTLYGCKRIITESRFSPSLMNEICNQYKVTTLFAPPYGIVQLLQMTNLQPFSSLRLFMTGGAVVSQSLCKAFSPWLPIGKLVPYYGSGEGDWLTDAQYSNIAYSLLPNTHFKIIGEDSKSVGYGEIGEICYRNVVMFLGYLNDPVKTTETIVDGWIHSGDLGYFDENNFLFIVDRANDLMKFEMHHIFPSELEEIINQCEGVIYSCVVGVTQSDGNDVIFAFVVKDQHNQTVTEVMIENFTNSHVTNPKKVRGGVHFVDSLPMTPSSKIQRAKIKKMAEEMLERKYNS